MLNGVRHQDADTELSSPEATCQSAYWTSVTSWTHTGAWRGQMPGNGYWLRHTTSIIVANVAGFPWFT